VEQKKEWYCARCEETKGRVMIGAQHLEEVEAFDYLGTRQNSEGSSTKTMLHRMMKATKCFRALMKLWGSNSVNLYVKGKAYETLVRRVLLHGAAAWITTNDDLQMLETWDAGNIRRILHVSRRQHIRNTDARMRLNIASSIEVEVRRARLRMVLKIGRSCEARGLECINPAQDFTCRYLHVLMKENDSYARNYSGRPLKDWTQCVKDDLSLGGLGLHSGLALARTSVAKFKQTFLQ